MTSTPKENYRQTLAQLKNKLLSSRFLRWWLSELSGMVPAWMRSSGTDTSSFAVVRLIQGNVLFQLFDNGHIQEVGNVQLQALDAMAQRQTFIDALDKIRPGKREVVLALPHERVLRKILTLPMATEENLRQVLEFQIEEHTPFTLDKVYFGYRILKRDFERGQLAVEFVAAPRGMVDQDVQLMSDWGARVQAVVAQEMLIGGVFVNLVPALQGKMPSLWRQGINPWFASLVLLLALAAMALPIAIKREAVVQMLPWVEKGRKAASAADDLRRELEARVDEHNYVLEKRAALPAVIVALEELTRVLPDDTWVQQLDIKGKELKIQGETASSVRLIGLFEQSRLFYDAGFRSPLTKGANAGTERYQLALQMRPVPPGDATPVAATVTSMPDVATGTAAAAQASGLVPLAPPALAGAPLPSASLSASPASAINAPAQTASKKP